jgi:hypothetical protein
MASFFNLILDTLAPSGLLLKINNGSQYTTKNDVTLSLSLDDTDTTGYQMKIWGIDGVSSESEASWETYSASKDVTLSNGDGLKTIYVKVRDDVYNESSSASASITLNTSVPAVTITGPDVSKISKVSPKNVATFSFVSDVDFIEYKVKVVPSNSSLQDAGVQIGTSGGSTNMSGTGTYKANTAISCKIYGQDLETASSGDGTKIIKVFVKNSAGTWSVA